MQCNKSALISDQIIEVKDSLVHGKGLFALTDFPEETPIMIISGEVIDGDECERREEEEGNVFIFWNGDNYIDSKNEIIRYINHNCEPNCYVDERDENSLLLVATREIKNGEEITIDYGYDEIYKNCNCSKCK